jgi:hypothetical protein
MVPLDARLVHPEAARLFKENASRMSLLVHGLNHEHRELVKPLPEAARAAALVRALAQIEGFERRSGVHISRVMCAPHGEASEDYLATMLGFGFEAQFADLPFPWLTDDPPAGPALTYWRPANFVAGGLPVIPRYPLTYDSDEIVLRAYLDHPLVLYGHHEDVEDGLDLLARVASLVNGLGTVRWCSAEEIARTNYLTRRRGDVFEVALDSRRVEVHVPDGITTLRVHIPPVHGRAAEPELVVGGRTVAVEREHGAGIAEVRLTDAMPLRLELRARDRVARNALRPAALRPWPIARRVLTEGRDRLRPIFR